MALGPNKEMIEYLTQTGLDKQLVESMRNVLKDITITNQYRQFEEKNKQGRNERCACGSGLKYKRCCGK